MTLAVIGYQQVLAHQFIDSLVQSTDLVTDLRAFVGTTVPSSDSGVCGTAVAVFGVAAIGDGGAGLYFWNAAAAATDDGFNVIQPTGLGTGRWLRATPGGATLATVTSTGAVAVASWQRTLVWAPTVPAATTMTLPARPVANEPHSFKNQLSSSAYPLIVAANAGQTIDGEPEWVLGSFNDALSVVWWLAQSMWIKL